MRVVTKLLGSRLLVAVLVLASIVAACLYLMPHAADKRAKSGGGTDELTVTWLAGGDRVNVVGLGLRPRSDVEIRVGDQLHIDARVDDTGSLRQEVALAGAAAGSGTSVVVVGRAPGGATKTMVTTVPARAEHRGPVDVVPWSVGGLMAVLLASLLSTRLRKRAATQAAAKDVEPVMTETVETVAPAPGATRPAKARRNGARNAADRVLLGVG